MYTMIRGGLMWWLIPHIRLSDIVLERSCVVNEVLLARHNDQLLQLVHSDLTVGLVVKCIAEALSPPSQGPPVLAEEG